MRIRTATFNDLDKMAYLSAQIQQDQYEFEPELFLVPDDVGDKEYKRYWKQILNGKDNRVFVAEIDGDIKGYISAHIIRFNMPFMVSKNLGRIGTIVVSRTMQRSGVGRSLSEHAEQWLISVGAEAVALEVLEKNKDAQSFYTTQGYRARTRTLSKNLSEH
ncbi:GNAT family N-acetyltransferase [Marinomonas balearica]|uniref:Ribosomal protein S18 acetylase RimI-like enzyme n=1 Tax=Marinomonas balearica TaxID=491947 RepID=A0A4V3CHJ3_9GAMM|nr:GNAT family N-acetyltransferase [Marinomonas balearica]TDP01863.1 ribosomal protein S18 acetylase RimI-like enzyme [Marinomonas balearica]